LRIISLLPALTELVATLGHADSLVAVSHECDVPAQVERLPRVTRSRIDFAGSSASIDAQVSQLGGGLNILDEARVAQLAPDLILTQSQCDVCAIDESSVRALAATLANTPRVFSVNPSTLDDVLLMFQQVADVLGNSAPEKARAFLTDFQVLREKIAAARVGKPRPRVLLLEWIDPPFCAGHWNPELVAIAGADEVLGGRGCRSRRITWSEIKCAEPEVILVAACGLTLDRIEQELEHLRKSAIWNDLPAVRAGRVVLADGNDYFSRPGPRLLDSLLITLAAVDRPQYLQLVTGGTPAPNHWRDWLGDFNPPH
jgi:iron complex transport system substrate-binding protein